MVGRDLRFLWKLTIYNTYNNISISDSRAGDTDKIMQYLKVSICRRMQPQIFWYLKSEDT